MAMGSSKSFASRGVVPSVLYSVAVIRKNNGMKHIYIYIYIYIFSQKLILKDALKLV